ncbi:MAG: hypothetical protein CME70_20780 [Halobacteriovorax sp.]|nr:hypothetical protein [Halobacteriovorax sp.]|tara:strand:+ start:3841 stop:4347 length:507 start_codon:yes stop_codon:yes gene_type:complete
MSINILQTLEFINNRLSNIENNIARMEDKLDFSIQLQRNHLIRIKNGEEIDDNMVLMGRPYNDLNPSKAYSIYNNPDHDFILVDVSAVDYQGKKIEGSIHIPLEELGRRYAEIQSRTLPVLIVSEQGLRSIQASEMLVKKGFFNINNVSGGLKFWPGFRLKEITTPAG